MVSTTFFFTNRRKLRRYFLTFKEPRNRRKGNDSASLCSLAGRYDNPVPTRFLAPVDCSKIPALSRHEKRRVRVACREGAGRRLGHQWHALRQRRQVQHLAVAVVGACGMPGSCWAEARPPMACSTSEETGTTYCHSCSGCPWHAGKVLGGGSAINGMLYVRRDRYRILP